MMAHITSAEIAAVGITTPLGLDAKSTSLAVRAGLCQFLESPLLNKKGEPQVMSLIADTYLPPLKGSSRAEPESSAARLSRLGTYALQEAYAECPESPPLLLALPERREGVVDRVSDEFLRDLSTQAGVALDERNSRQYRQGGAAGLLALHDALQLLATGTPYVLVGAIDSYFHPPTLEALDAEGRLAGGSMDGFIPGEGAAFVLLASRAARRRLGLPPIAQLAGVGIGAERGHRYSSEPYRGDGLSETFQALFTGLPAGAPKVNTVYHGFNGESLPAKEWGVARLRSAERFSAELRTEHPADCLGDTGTSLGVIMLALAALELRHGRCAAPCLVWSSSDRELRAAALLTTLD